MPQFCIVAEYKQACVFDFTPFSLNIFMVNRTLVKINEFIVFFLCVVLTSTLFYSSLLVHNSSIYRIVG